MSPLDQLNGYLRALETRLRAGLVSRGTMVLGGVALGLTVALVLVMNALAFSPGSVWGSRILLWAALIAALVAALILPLRRLNQLWAARLAERAIPDFEQRLVTIAERQNSQPADPFLPLLAADALDVAARCEAASVFPTARLTAFAAAAVASFGVLAWLVFWGPGYWGHGASLLWAGGPKSGNALFYDLKLTPGDQAVRKNSDQLISVRPVGFSPDSVRLYARYKSASKWEPVDMRPQPGGDSFEFLFAGLMEDVEYYAQSGAVRTRNFQLRVLELPNIKRIGVNYKFPSWTGMQPVSEERGGDLRAVEGTEAMLTVVADRPLEKATIVIDNEREIPLEAAGNNTYRAAVRVEKDGMYHVAAVDRGQRARLTEDFFIEARKENAPTVRVARPGRDFKASPIEEVGIVVEASDDFGLQEVTLHYSVNGGPEQTRPLAAKKGLREAGGETLIALEDYKLVPGDLVSFYASARDARSVTRTDMFFIEAQPFEKEYSQSQQSGGGGGQGEQDDNQISARQKEIISATFNQQREKGATAAEAAEAGKFLSDVQSKLRAQAQSLAKRMQSRELTMQNQEFLGFAKDMTAAADAMAQAAERLQSQKWQEALPAEQKALQHLLRAEATFRQIQVAFGSRGGGGGRGGAGRDLESLFDLELDTEKNQYETGSQAQQSAGEQSKQVDEALEKLKELARRQQELAQQQRQNKQSFQQRWQQEMLRREAEQLQRQMEQLSRGENSQQASSSQSGQGQGSSGQSSQQQGSQGQQSSQRQQQQQQRQQMASRRGEQVDPRVKQALERLRQATEDMRQASGSAAPGQSQGQGQSEAEARRAAERLKEAADTLSGMRRQDAGDKMDSIARHAENLADQQRALSNKLRQMYGSVADAQKKAAQQPGVSRQQTEQLAAERQQMANELNQLEKEMQEAVRGMASGQRAASNKLREALGELQQNELGLRLKYSAEWIRRGMGSYAYLREQPVTQMLEKLRDQVKEAQRALEQGGKDGKGQQGVESALEQVERMRQQLEAAGRQPGQQQGQGEHGQGRQPGQQQGQGQQGQGQQPGQQQGQGQQAGGRQPGQQQGQGQGEGRGQGQIQQPGQGQGGGMGGDEFRGGRGGQRQTGSDFSAMNRGDYMPGGPEGQPLSAEGMAGVERGLRDSVRDLRSLRQQLTESPETAREVDGLIREMQRLDPARFKGNPAMIEQMRAQVLAGLEQLEMQLRRKLDDQQSGQVRSGGGQPVPPGYRDSVAEYFRRLSKGN